MKRLALASLALLAGCTAGPAGTAPVPTVREPKPSPDPDDDDPYVTFDWDVDCETGRQYEGEPSLCYFDGEKWIDDEVEELGSFEASIP